MKLQKRSQDLDNERQLRMSQTEAESLLWRELRNRNSAGLKFRRQHRAGFFIVDFYCVEARVGIELDGKHHRTEEGTRNDEARSQWLRDRGIQILRFTNEDVVANTKLVVRRIVEVCRER